MRNFTAKRVLAVALACVLIVGYLGIYRPTTVEASTNVSFPNRTPDQARRDIAQAIGMDEYLSATISTLHDFHYGDILQLTAAVFIFDGDRNHGQQRFLQNWVDMYQPFYDRIPFIVNFEHVFYFPGRQTDEVIGTAIYVRDNSDWFLNHLRQLPNFAAIDTIVVMDVTRGSEISNVTLDGKTYYFIHASLGGADGNTLHGAIHDFQGTYYHMTARSVVNVSGLTGFRPHAILTTDEWRQSYPDLPHYTQWNAGALHALSRAVVMNIPPEVGMPITRQPWSGGNPDHGWADFRAYTYFEAATQAEIDSILASTGSFVDQIALNWAHYYLGPTTVAEWNQAHASMVATGARRTVLEYVHYLRWAQTSPKSITRELDHQGNQVGFDVALAKWLRNMRVYILPDGTSWHDLNLHSRYFVPTFHQLPVRGEATANPNPTPTPPPTAEQPSSWAENAISRADEMGLLTPSFRTGFTRATTRAEFTVLAIALYEHVTGTTVTGRVTFTDTTDTNVEKAAYIGIVGGVGNNRFDPNSPLTREQAAVMLARLANVIGQPLSASTPTFADNNQMSSWARDGVGQVQAVGIMSGVGNNLFAPQNPYTIEQSIVTIMRLYDILN